MAWQERTDRRTQRNKLFQDSEQPNRFAVDCHLPALHYPSTLDSDEYDAEVDFAPERAQNAQLDGWRVVHNSWRYALGTPGEGVFAGQDGVVGFGGRQGYW